MRLAGGRCGNHANGDLDDGHTSVDGSAAKEAGKSPREARETPSAPVVDQTTHVQKRTRKGRPRRTGREVRRPREPLGHEPPPRQALAPEAPHGFPSLKPSVIGIRHSACHASGMWGDSPGPNDGSSMSASTARVPLLAVKRFDIWHRVTLLATSRPHNTIRQAVPVCKSGFGRDFRKQWHTLNSRAPSDGSLPSPARAARNSPTATSAEAPGKIKRSTENEPSIKRLTRVPPHAS